tara:strand:+ start:168 stop:1052 length:885 start_codon:yes stop_codon:yes gene_type:complete
MDNFNRCLKLVGNTPLVEYKKNVFAKFECYNPTGSIKDRIVFHIFKNAIENNLINLNDKNLNIIEASSGNTGISVSFVSSILNLKCKIIMPSDMSDERKKYIKMFGAELIEVNEGDFKGAINLRNELALKNNWFNINQFNNQLNIDCHYHTTGNEIIKQLHPKIPDILITGTGTGGTLMGVSKKLKEINPKLEIIVIEPDESPTMSGGKPGLHKIQGIGDGSKFLADINIIDRIIRIKSEEAIKKMKELYKQGYFIGVSAAANILASEIISKEKPDKIIVTFMCDRGDRYLSML